MKIINNVRYKAYDTTKMAYSEDVVVGKLILAEDALMFFAEYHLSSFWASLGYFFTPLVNKFGKKPVEGAEELKQQADDVLAKKDTQMLRELAEGHLGSFLIEKKSVTNKTRVFGKDIYITSDLNMFTFTVGSKSEFNTVKEYLGM